MMVIIVGENRIEYNRIKKRDFEKVFFDRRSQTYKVVPDGLVRLKMVDHKGRVKWEEAVVYPENGSVPYDVVNGVSYQQDDVFQEIDLVRDIGHKGIFGNNYFMKRVNEISDAAMSLLGIGILAGVFVWIAINMVT